MKKILAVSLIAFISACSSDQPVAVRQSLELMPRTNLDVLSVQVLDQSNQQIVDPAMNFQPTIGGALRQALTQDLIAVGTTGEATVIIRDAILKGQALAHAEHDWVDRPQASKYSAQADVEIQVTAREGNGQVVAQASRFVTLPENPTVIERQNAYNTVLNGIMHDLGGSLSSGIRSHLGQFVVTAPIMDHGGRN